MRREAIALSVFIVLSSMATFCRPKAMGFGYHSPTSEAAGGSGMHDRGPDGQAVPGCDETYSYASVLSHDPSHVPIDDMALKTSITFSKDGAPWNVAWHHCNPADDKLSCKGEKTEFDSCPCLMINFEQSDRSIWFDITSTQYRYDAAMTIIPFGENSNVLLVKADLGGNMTYEYTRHVWLFGLSVGLPAVIWEGVLGEESQQVDDEGDFEEYPLTPILSFKDEDQDGEPEMELKLCCGAGTACRTLVLDGCGGRYPKYDPEKLPVQCIIRAVGD